MIPIYLYNYSFVCTEERLNLRPLPQVDRKLIKNIENKLYNQAI